MFGQREMNMQGILKELHRKLEDVKKEKNKIMDQSSFEDFCIKQGYEMGLMYAIQCLKKEVHK